jgi:hypothetical protein
MDNGEYMTDEDVESLDASDVDWRGTALNLQGEVSRLTRELRAARDQVALSLTGNGQARILIADLTERLENLRSGVLQALNAGPDEDPVCAARFVRSAADAFASRVSELERRPRGEALEDAGRDAQVELLTELMDEEMTRNGATLALERLAQRREQLVAVRVED